VDRQRRGFDGLVAIGVVEVHPWAATVDDIERADYLVLDLDRGAGVAWDFVIETALRAQPVGRRGVAPWPKLTGGKGLHLVAPFARPRDGCINRRDKEKK
jgi:bifunctional non-homologous end joining protein LigD